MWKPLFLTVILQISCSIQALELDHPLVLSELIDTALKNNPKTQRAWWNANRAASALGSAKSAYYPYVDFNASIEHGRDFKFFNSGPDTEYTVVNADLIAGMLLFDFGERDANVRAARMALSAVNWQTDWEIQGVIIEVLRHAYGVLHFQETVAAALMSLQDAERMVSVSQALQDAGLTAITDVHTNQATLAQMQIELAQQKALLDIERAHLITAMGYPIGTCVQLAPIDKLPQPEKVSVDQLIALANEQRADLLAKRARVSEANANMDATVTAYLPKITASGYGGYEHSLHDKAHGAHYSIALNFDMPLFTGFEATYQRQIAYADTQISEYELAQLELDMALDVLTHSRSLVAAQEMICYAKSNLDYALKAYEGTLEKYKAGKEKIAELSHTFRQLASARVRYSDIKTRWLVSLANLAYATGTLCRF